MRRGQRRRRATSRSSDDERRRLHGGRAAARRLLGDRVRRLGRGRHRPRLARVGRSARGGPRGGCGGARVRRPGVRPPAAAPVPRPGLGRLRGHRPRRLRGRRRARPPGRRRRERTASVGARARRRASRRGRRGRARPPRPGRDRRRARLRPPRRAGDRDARPRPHDPHARRAPGGDRLPREARPPRREAPRLRLRDAVRAPPARAAGAQRHGATAAHPRPGGRGRARVRGADPGERGRLVHRADAGDDSRERRPRGRGGARAPRLAGAGALVFDCAGRKRALGARTGAAVEAIAAAFGGEAPPLAGLWTRGEIGRVRGPLGDHNHAAVVVAFG